MLKGIQIQKGSLLGELYTFRTSVWRLFDVLAVVGGVWTPFFNAVPFLPFNCFLFPQSPYQGAITEEMLWAATMLAVLLICLCILNSPCQAYHELFCNSFDSAGILTLLIFIVTGILFFQMCQMHSRLFWDGLVALEFPQGKETGSLWFGRSFLGSGSTPWSLSSWLLGQPLGCLNKSLPADLPSGRLPSLSVTWGDCHKSDFSLTLPLDQKESGQERKQPIPGDVSRDGHTSLIQFLCLPFVVGIAPDSVHPMLLHYYSVHPRLSTHHPGLYLYQSSTLIYQGSHAKIKLHRVGRCNLYTPHASTPLDPTSNSDRLPHP